MAGMFNAVKMISSPACHPAPAAPRKRSKAARAETQATASPSGDHARSKSSQARAHDGGAKQARTANNQSVHEKSNRLHGWRRSRNRRFAPTSEFWFASSVKLPQSAFEGGEIQRGGASSRRARQRKGGWTCLSRSLGNEPSCANLSDLTVHEASFFSAALSVRSLAPTRTRCKGASRRRARGWRAARSSRCRARCRNNVAGAIGAAVLAWG